MTDQEKATFVVPQEQAKKAIEKLEKRDEMVDIFDLPKLPRNRSVNKHGTKYIYEELSEISEEIVQCRKSILQRYR